MKILRLVVALAGLSVSLSACVVHTHSSCHNDCWYEHGHQVCRQVC